MAVDGERLLSKLLFKGIFLHPKTTIFDRLVGSVPVFIDKLDASFGEDYCLQVGLQMRIVKNERYIQYGVQIVINR